MVIITVFIIAAIFAATASAQAPASDLDAPAYVDTAAVGAQLVFDHVQGTEPWVFLSGHRTFVPGWGVAVARLTVGERFGNMGVQAEGEAYPRVGRLGYLYAAAAISPNDDVFVPRRAALELFTAPTPGLELSAGARLFHASSRSVFVYTGSVGAYRGNYWYSFRPYFVRDGDALSKTGQLSVRRYWAGRYDYVGVYLTATRGIDPTSDDPLRIGRSAELTSFAARVERLRPIREGRARFGYGLGVESEEFALSSRRLHLIATFRLERLLR